MVKSMSQRWFIKNKRNFFFLLLECLSHRTPSQALGALGVANAALFRGLLHINAVRKLAVKHLMR